MEIVVMKFGGTSVCSEEQRYAAFKHVYREVNAGYKVVVVVSAMGRFGEPYATDTLKELVSYNVSKQESDRLLACGEIISSIVISDFFQQQGLKSIALSPHDVGIKTNDVYSNAEVERVDVSVIKQYLNTYDVIIAPGFVGTTNTHNIATLGRGGSDTSAVVLGAALNAVYVDIYSDVEGVMTADPKLVKNARVLEKISYDNLIALASRGAKVIHLKAIEYAKNNHVNLRLRQTTKETIGTYVVDQQVNTLSITYTNQYVRYELRHLDGFVACEQLVKHGSYWYAKSSDVADVEKYLQDAQITYEKEEQFVRVSIIDQQTLPLETTYFVEAARLIDTMNFLHYNLI